MYVSWRQSLSSGIGWVSEMKDMDRQISNIAASTKLGEKEAASGGGERQESEGGPAQGEESKGGVQAPPNTKHGQCLVLCCSCVTLRIA